MAYTILTQGTLKSYHIAVNDLKADVILHQRGGWRPQGGVACCLVDDRFVVMQAMVRDEEVKHDD